MRALIGLRTGLTLLTSALVLPGAAIAQDRLVRERPVEVSITFGMNVPLTGDPKAQQSTMTQAREALYEMAAEECGLILRKLATSCLLQRMDVTSQAQSRQGTGTEMLQVSGRWTYRIEPKP
jgi:hypothetical protein